MDADEVIQWLRAQGYQPGPNGPPLTRSNISKYLKAENQPFWEAIMRVASKAKAADADSQAAPAEAPAQSPAQLKQELEAKRKRLLAMVAAQKALLAAQERVKAHTKDLVDSEAALAAKQQQLEDAQHKSRILAEAQARQAKVLPALAQRTANLQQLVNLAKRRAEGASSGPDAQRLLDVCEDVKKVLSARADQWLTGVPEEGAVHVSPPQMSTVLELEDEPKSRVLALQSMTPAQVMSLTTKVLQQGLEVIQRLGQPQESNHSAQTQAPDDTLPTQPHPDKILRQLQQAHVSTFVATERHLARIEEVQQELDAVREAAKDVLQWPYNQHRLEEAYLVAYNQVLQNAVVQLRAEAARGTETQKAVQEVHLKQAAATAKALRLNKLIHKLLEERHATLQRWAAQDQEHTTWSQVHFVKASHELRDVIKQCVDLLLHEACAAAESQATNRQSYMPYTLPEPPATGLSVLTPPPRSMRNSGRAECDEASTLQLLQQAVAAQGVTPAGAAQGAVRAPATPTSKALAGGGGAPAQSAALSQLLTVLRTIRTSDMLATQRCPVQLLQNLAGLMSQHQLDDTWLSCAQPFVDRSQGVVQEQSRKSKEAQQVMAALREEDRTKRCQVHRECIKESKRFLEYIDSSVSKHMEDFKTLPAMSLLPDEQRMGLNMAEWRAVVQELHESIEDAQRRLDAKNAAQR